MTLPPEIRVLVECGELPAPDGFVDACERPPFLPPAARAILFGEPLPESVADAIGVPVDAGVTPKEER